MYKTHHIGCYIDAEMMRRIGAHRLRLWQSGGVEVSMAQYIRQALLERLDRAEVADDYERMPNENPLV